MKREHWLLPLLLLAAACAEHPESPSSSGPTLATQAPQSEYVSTPVGWYHRSCVYQIPEDAVVDRSGKVTRKDGSTYQLAKCMFPARMGGLRPEPRGVEVPPH